ncbi:unnamed protein product [Adineta ricciae]|uniref:Uncharacterized protein n=1 Tax=Adineta ricciae TaxID=249248 RepID=A0A814RNS6_ADIRI|nr:unnamed protein product [Adineta ricciae]CAF1135104.1 unnamed protein product [Adineta ricciae]
MTCKLNWSIRSDDDENSHQSLLSDCDFDYDHNPLRRRYANEKRSILALNTLAINRYEPPTARLRTKPIGFSQPTKNLFLTNPVLFSKQSPFDNRFVNIPSDSINSLADRLDKCSLDENNLNKNSCWSCHHSKRQINPFSAPRTSRLFIQSKTTTTLFDQDHTKLWSRTFSTTSTIPENQPIDSPRKDSPEQSLLTEEDSLPNHSFLSKIFFLLIIFMFGLVLGYLFTHVFPSTVLYQWFIRAWNHVIRLSIESLEACLRYVFSF